MFLVVIERTAEFGLLAHERYNPTDNHLQLLLFSEPLASSIWYSSLEAALALLLQMRNTNNNFIGGRDGKV